MKNPLLVPEIREILRKKKFKLLKEFFIDLHEKEVAEYLSMHTPDEIWQIINVFEPNRRAEIFTYMDMDVQVAMIVSGAREKVRDLLLPMSNDDRADLFKHLEKNVADKLLLFLPPKERTDILSLTSYREGTNGAIMTTDFVDLNENDTVENAIRKIRRFAPSKETIYYNYVTADDNTLLGFISLRKLIVSKPKEKLGQLMKTDMITTGVDEDQEVAANLIQEYDLIAIPVIDMQHRIIGIITYDDAIDIIQDEQTEDMERLMGISGAVSEKTYLEVPVMNHFKKRVVWVIILGGFGLLTGMIIQGFQSTLEALIVLSFYMPLLNAAGGNTGSQSATVVLRSLSLNELKSEDIFRVIKKEFAISFLLSICLALMTYGRVMLFSQGEDIPVQFSISLIAFVISLALAIQVIWSTVFGAIIPILATKMKIDPAVFSSPALATLVDMGGITIYFTCAKLILGI
ncbi:MAG: magnesium transporter [Spirochaetes bacterium]|nr:magnesium transporter [Spirochaetota bacterium]